MIEAQKDPLHHIADKEAPVDLCGKQPPSCLSILATCRQVYLESRGIFYADLTIYLNSA